MPETEKFKVSVPVRFDKIKKDETFESLNIVTLQAVAKAVKKSVCWIRYM